MQEKLINRFELKFLVSREKLGHLLALYRHENLLSYHVTSIYFDTKERKFYNQVLNGDTHKEKFRLRFYNDDPKQTYWEHKIKANKSVIKIRQPIGQCPMDLSDLVLPVGTSNYDSLKPQVVICYKRFVLKDNAQERITLDENIKYRSCVGNTNHATFGGFISERVLEVKTKEKISFQTYKCLERLGLEKTNFSKYQTCLT